MKNLNKVRTYWGYTFIFEDKETMNRFLDLFHDLFISYELGVYGEDLWVRVRVVKGVIDKVKDGLGDMVTCKRRRYYVKKAA